MSGKTFKTVVGLLLSRKALRVLKNAGIYTPATVTLEHQHLAKRYVVRGLESGGAVPDLGRYVTFAGPDGERIAYLHPVESIAVNGLHAVVIAPVLVRVDILRKGRTYEVLITEHKPGESENGSRPELESTILFRGVHRRIELDLEGKDKAQAGSVLPTFISDYCESRHGHFLDSKAGLFTLCAFWSVRQSSIRLDHTSRLANAATLRLAPCTTAQDSDTHCRGPGPR